MMPTLDRVLVLERSALAYNLKRFARARFGGVAKLARESGVSEATLRRMTRGESPQFDNLCRVAYALQKSVADLTAAPNAATLGSAELERLCREGSAGARYVAGHLLERSAAAAPTASDYHATVLHQALVADCEPRWLSSQVYNPFAAMRLARLVRLKIEVSGDGTFGWCLGGGALFPALRWRVRIHHDDQSAAERERITYDLDETHTRNVVFLNAGGWSVERLGPDTEVTFGVVFGLRANAAFGDGDDRQSARDYEARWFRHILCIFTRAIFHVVLAAARRNSPNDPSGDGAGWREDVRLIRDLPT